MPSPDDLLDIVLGRARLAPPDALRAELAQSFHRIVDYVGQLPSSSAPQLPEPMSADTPLRDDVPDTPANDAFVARVGRREDGFILTSRAAWRPSMAPSTEVRSAPPPALDPLGAFVWRPTTAAQTAGGPLANWQAAVKDGFCTQGVPTTAGSHMLQGWVAPYESTATRRLWGAGAALAGKTAMDAFAMGSTGEHHAGGPTLNPWDPERVAGGSSSGSAAAVAAGLARVALGSDTGGSVRLPASYCGVVGFKPSYGRISRAGLVAFASSLDTPGILARTVDDVESVYDAVAGHDPADATSLRDPLGQSHVGKIDLAGVRIGLPAELFALELAEPIRAALAEACAALERAGARMVDVSLPATAHAIAAYQIIVCAEASSNLARYDGVRFGLPARPGESVASLRGRGFEDEVQRRIVLGTFVLSEGYRDAFYLRAQALRRRVRGDFETALAHCDLLLGPTATQPPPRIGALGHDPLAMYATDVCTVGASLAGIPAISLPCGRDAHGLPIGLQLMAPARCERRVLAIARAYEALRGPFDRVGEAL